VNGGGTLRGAGIVHVSTSVLAVALLWLVTATPLAPASQTFPGPPSIEQLARAADLVVAGIVIAAAGEWDAGHATIQTRVELSVAERLKGAAASPLTFTQLGGRVGGDTSIVGGGASFEPGERVLVFLARRPDGSLRLADLIHGKFTIVRDPATGRDYAQRATGAPGADRVELDHVRAQVRRALGGQG
jgi:hypothetical protein